MREFRAHHDELVSAGATVAGISLDPLERAKAWAERLALPYPLLSDADRRAGESFGLIRRLGLGGWTIELLKRATVLADREGFIRAVWEEVKIKTHVKDVLEAVRHLRALESQQPPASSSR
jgi:peroxiredoxin Q/BCP